MNLGCNMAQPVPEIDLSKADALAAKTGPALLEALAAEVQEIVKGGINIRSLMELSKFSHVAQELLMVRTPLAEVRRKKRNGGGMPQIYSNGGALYSGVSSVGPYQTMYDEDLEPMTQEAQQNETFGATLSRELVSAIGAIKSNSAPNIEELIARIAQAKEGGLDNVVAMLEKNLATLLGGDEDVVDAEAKPSTPVEALEEPDVTGATVPVIESFNEDSPAGADLQ